MVEGAGIDVRLLKNVRNARGIITLRSKKLHRNEDDCFTRRMHELIERSINSPVNSQFDVSKNLSLPALVRHNFAAAAGSEK